MGNICFKGEDDGENNYLAGGQRTNQSSGSRSQPVDRELLAAAAEKRLKASNERGIKTHTVQQKSKADLPENMGETALKWQVG